MMNDLRRLDLNLLRVFAVLMEELSVSRSARRLGLSQPATSNALSRLRDVLGDALLVRCGNEMRPTPFALELRPVVDGALRDLSRGLAQAGTFEPRELKGTLTVGIDQYALALLGAPLARVLRAAAPEFRVSFVNAAPHERDADLIRGTFDVILGQVWQETPGIERDVLGAERFVGLVRRTHPLAGGTVTLDAYLSYPHALFSEIGRVPRNVDAGLSAVGRTRRIGLTAPSLTLLAEHVERTDDIMNIGREMAAALERRYDLARFDLPLPVPGFEVALLWPAQNTGAPMTEWLRVITSRLWPPPQVIHQVNGED